MKKLLLLTLGLLCSANAWGVDDRNTETSSSTVSTANTNKSAITPEWKKIETNNDLFPFIGLLVAYQNATFPHGYWPKEKLDDIAYGIVEPQMRNYLGKLPHFLAGCSLTKLIEKGAVHSSGCVSHKHKLRKVTVEELEKIIEARNNGKYIFAYESVGNDHFNSRLQKQLFLAKMEIFLSPYKLAFNCVISNKTNPESIAQIEFLIQNNIIPLGNKTQEGQPLLNVALENDQFEIAKLLINAGEPANSFYIADRAPIYIAYEKNQPELVNLMLQKGAKLKPVHEYGLFCTAITEGNEEQLKTLINQKADVNNCGNGGWETPLLNVALRKKQFEIAKLLINNGATVKKKNLNLDPLKLALQAKNQELIELIQQKRVYPLDNTDQSQKSNSNPPLE